MQKIFFGVCFLFLTCYYNTGSAQLYHNGRTLTTENGLSDNRITAIYKDVSGYIWIGTKNGLNKYNGRNFTIYKPQHENSISNEIITSITGDKEGNIWVGTMHGLNKFNPTSNTWTNWLPSPRDSPHNSLHNFLIWNVEMDEDGILWIACDVKEFTSYNPATNTFTYYNWPEFVKSISGKQTKPGYHAIQAFARKTKNEFWLASNRGLIHLNIETRAFTYVGGNYYADVFEIKYDPLRKEVWLSLEGGQVFRYQETTGSYAEADPWIEPYPSAYLPAAQRSETWIGSEKGLLKVNPITGDLLLHRHIPTLSFSLPPGGVTTTYMDPSGIGWIGTFNGIFMLDQNHQSSAFLPLITSANKEGANRMGGVFYDDESGIYFVCSVQPAGVFMVEKKSGQIRSIHQDQQGKQLPPCFFVKKINHQLWLLTEEKIYTINPDQNTVHHFPTPFDGGATIYRDIEMDPNGRIWISSFNKGILLYDTKNASFSTLSQPNSIFLQTAGTALAYDSAQYKMWIGTYGNYLFEYDFRSDSLASYHEKENVTSYVNLNLINDIAIDGSGKPWVATNSGGLFRYNPGLPFEKAFTQFDMRNGFQHNQFIAATPGEDSLLWLLSETGLSYIDTRFPEKEYVIQTIQQIAAYGSDPRFPHPIYYNKKEQEVLVATAGGLLFYYPQTSGKIEAFPLLVRTDVDSSHSFSFDGLYYGMDAIRFEYQLAGWSDEWHYVTGGASISFPNLSPGSYTFRMRALDGNDQVITESASLPFTISPPLWKKPWFLFILLAIVIWIVYRIIRSLQQKVRDQEILNQFATSLYGKTSVDDIFWDVAFNCILLLDFEDCVIYQYDAERKVLVQRAAAGPKSPHRSREINNPLEIPLGKGIVGTVAKTGKAERIGDTSKDYRYIVDDQNRHSEITIPIWVDGNLYGIIDSEHSKRYFYKPRHKRMLKNIAHICSERISKYLTEEKLRSKISRDLHDEMGSTLTSINILSKVAMARQEEKTDMKEYLQKIKDHSGNMMESMSDMIWAINPANDSLDKVLIKMKEFAAEMLEPVGISYYFDTQGFSHPGVLNLEERKDLYLVFKEAINNIVKYSRATEVSILLKFDKEELSLMILDNGIGFDTSAVNSGNGIGNMKARAETMGAALQIESITGTGTTLFLKKTIT